MSDFTSFRKYLVGQDCSEVTVHGYLANIEQFAVWFKLTNGEELTPERLTPTDVKQYRQYLLTVQRRKASTVNRHLAALSAYVRSARANGEIEGDPTENVKSIRQVSSAPKWLDRNEQYALQRAIERDVQISKLQYPKRWVTRRRDASLVLLLLHTGLRLSEATALRLEDFQISERKGSLMVQNGKGGKQRSIPLNADARKALEEWLAVRPESGTDHLWVSEGNDTEGLSPRAVQRVLHRYGKDAKLEDLTPHVCRHTFAKNLVDRGVGLEKVAALLGHANLNTTRLYTTPDIHDLEKAVQGLER